ncbi:MAG: hypothetical protein M0Z31_01120 [Clostridia bacterium]|nr:hypothetical protein [Clostridia bacterium]
MRIPVRWTKWDIRLGAALVVFLLIWGGYNLYIGYSSVDPEQLLSEAIANTNKATSFRFKTGSVIYVDGRQETLSRITGEKSKEGLHIKGEMLNTAVDIYQIGNKTYFKDIKDDNWIVIDDNNLEKSQMLMAELNPLAYFTIKDSLELKVMDVEKVNGRWLVKLEMKPDLDNPWLEVLWTDFHYTVWVDKGKRVISKAVLRAREKTDDKTKLELTIDFSDYNRDLKITVPKVKKEVSSDKKIFFLPE